MKIQDLRNLKDFNIDFVRKNWMQLQSLCEDPVFSGEVFRMLKSLECKNTNHVYNYLEKGNPVPPSTTDIIVSRNFSSEQILKSVLVGLSNGNFHCSRSAFSQFFLTKGCKLRLENVGSSCYNLCNEITTHDSCEIYDRSNGCNVSTGKNCVIVINGEYHDDSAFWRWFNSMDPCMDSMRFDHTKHHPTKIQCGNGSVVIMKYRDSQKEKMIVSKIGTDLKSDIWYYFDTRECEWVEYAGKQE